MASKRNFKMVKKALKGPAPPPFSKPTKENKCLNDQTLTKLDMNISSSVRKKNLKESALTDSNNTSNKELNEIPTLSSSINANILSVDLNKGMMVNESQSLTLSDTNVIFENNATSSATVVYSSNNSADEMNEESILVPELSNATCMEISRDESVEMQNFSVLQSEVSQDLANTFNFKQSTPIIPMLQENNEVTQKVYECNSSNNQENFMNDSQSKTSATSINNERAFNVSSLKSLCLKHVIELMNTDRNLAIGEISVSHFKIVEENSDNIEDFSGTESGDDWRPIKNTKRKRLLSSSSSSSSTSSSSESSSNSTSSSSSKSTSSSSASSISSSTAKKGKKRRRNVTAWKKNKMKALKNCGKEYVSRTGKTVKAKEMKPPCSEKCRLSCRTKFTSDERKKIFDSYWQLSSFQRQRDFLSSCTTVLQVPIRRIKTTSRKERKPNCCFAFLREGKTTRVCKTFLINTLGIGERTLRTVTEAKTSDSGMIPEDKRGKHSKHSKLDPEISQSVRDHINSIPRVESHYIRANTTREFIDGGLTISEMHRNYKEQREALNKAAANYDLYARIFNNEFNISFFIPKKDQCDVCEAYKNAEGEDKLALEEGYKKHQTEKELSRKEKKRDITACREANSSSIVGIYDLQAVMPVPIGESSAFFYKSKLNCYNFTITDIKNKTTSCYFWHEGLGNRGAIEIGSCVFKFLQEISVSHPGCDIVLYSDNCCGQQKNRYILSMYYYAVSVLNINSLTHKFLIRGHTQNEGDNAHSVIEKSIKKSKKSGPIYVPSQYVQIIRNAKKTGKPYVVHELNYDSFIELKTLCDELGMNITKDIDGNAIKLTEIKIIKFTKGSDTYFFKTSYAEKEWVAVPIKIRSGRSSRKETNIETLLLKMAYDTQISITGRKKNDLKTLLRDNIVPKQYSYFYDSLF